MLMLSHEEDHAGLRRGREMMREQGGRVREGGVRAGGTVCCRWLGKQRRGWQTVDTKMGVFVLMFVFAEC
jgi:hypothetical protein